MYTYEFIKSTRNIFYNFIQLLIGVATLHAMALITRLWVGVYYQY